MLIGLTLEGPALKAEVMFSLHSRICSEGDKTLNCTVFVRSLLALSLYYEDVSVAAECLSVAAFIYLCEETLFLLDIIPRLIEFISSVHASAFTEVCRSTE